MFSPDTLPGPAEFRPEFTAYPDITHVVFDFDGTLSWLRHGWPQLMCRLFREYVSPRPGETEALLQERLLDDILSLNGRPSIYQMQRGVELAREKGGSAPTAENLMQEYQRRLQGAVQERTESIRRGGARRDDFNVHGGRALLDLLARRGLCLVILSGTIEPSVRSEAELLDLTRYFGAHIYGSRADLAQWSKGEVLERLLREEKIEGRHLLSFGDGPVEIELTKKAGGLAVGVASDEEINGSGKLDQNKRKQLVAAGADVLIADYRDADRLLQKLLGTEACAPSASIQR